MRREFLHKDGFGECKVYEIPDITHVISKVEAICLLSVGAWHEGYLTQIASEYEGFHESYLQLDLSFVRPVCKLDNCQIVSIPLKSFWANLHFLINYINMNGVDWKHIALEVPYSIPHVSLIQQSGILSYVWPVCASIDKMEVAKKEYDLAVSMELLKIRQECEEYEKRKKPSEQTVKPKKRGRRRGYLFGEEGGD